MTNNDQGYIYLDVETLAVDLEGLKVDAHPAKELDLVKIDHLDVRQVDWDDINEDDLEWLSESALPTNDSAKPEDQPGILGLAVDMGGSDECGKPPALAFASVDRVLILRMPRTPMSSKSTKIIASITHCQSLIKAAFRMYEKVQLLFYHYHLHFAKSYDLGDTFQKIDSDLVLRNNLGLTIDRDVEREPGHLLALDAWAACLVAHAAAATEAFRPEMPHINTFELPGDQLRAVATGSAVAACLTSMDTREHKGYMESARRHKGNYVFTQGRYSTRARREDKVSIQLADGTVWSCKVIDTDGRDITVRPIKPHQAPLNEEEIKDTPCLVIVAPHEPPQEEARQFFARNFMLGGVDLNECRAIRTLFLPSEHAEVEVFAPLSSSVKVDPLLNEAQSEAIIKIFDRSSGLLVHGPPGSGKTTVIAHAAKAFIQSDSSPDATVMIVANSNAAIKQCAEALLKHRIAAFRLVTSAEYFVGWHAHHYSASLQRKLIRSDELAPGTSREELIHLFKGVRIILCTLATLATRKLDNLLFERKVPLLIADEASQIVWSTFLPALWKLRLGLRKVVFVGDSHQLPPYGASQAPELVRSVFEIESRPLALHEVLLDTCYRMPIPLGEFVSDLVYKGTLISKHDLLTWSCVRFIDVETGRETRVGVSWSNPEEALACRTLVEKYYSASSFCIITPYDAQRDLIERELKLAGLPHDGRVQSIDAAQGSECDYVIISLVRTSRSMGFLADVRRMNVMLTRQRRGLCVVAHPRFLANAAAASLVGQLAHYASNRVAWSEKLHIPLREVVANIASMPMGTT